MILEINVKKYFQPFLKPAEMEYITMPEVAKKPAERLVSLDLEEVII